MTPARGTGGSDGRDDRQGQGAWGPGVPLGRRDGPGMGRAYGVPALACRDPHDPPRSVREVATRGHRPRGGVMPDAAREDVVALGRGALGRLGARVGWLYLASASAAIVVGGLTPLHSSATGRRDTLLALLTAAAVLSCGFLLRRATVLDARPLDVVGALAGFAAATSAATATAEHLDWHAAQYLGSVAATSG